MLSLIPTTTFSGVQHSALSFYTATGIGVNLARTRSAECQTHKVYQSEFCLHSSGWLCIVVDTSPSNQILSLLLYPKAKSETEA